LEWGEDVRHFKKENQPHTRKLLTKKSDWRGKKGCLPTKLVRGATKIEFFEKIV